MQIRSLDRQHRVGVVTKKWSGLAREYFHDGNSFGICFPVDLDVKIKAVLIGASILVVSIVESLKKSLNMSQIHVLGLRVF